MENAEKQKLVNEPISQIKQTINTRLKDHDTIVSNLKNSNEETIARIMSRLESIESGSMEFIEKRKFISKINRYLSVILYESGDVRIKPEKARVKDLEKLTAYFNLIDNVLQKVENKIDDKLADKIADKLAEAEHRPARYIDMGNSDNITKNEEN